MDGFTFNDKHSSEFGLWYIPSPANRFLDTPSFELRDTTVTGRHGGYYYGEQIGIREFSLECFFEDINMSTFERAIGWIKHGEQGE